MHSCLMRRHAARRRSPSRAATCASRSADACGFISNTAFDSGRSQYSPPYEETQGFSPTFHASRATWPPLVEQLDLRGKHLIEIGCGKGEFLRCCASSAATAGIGYRPGYVPERLESEARRPDRRRIRDLYAERYAHLGPTPSICRHTLEHIAPSASSSPIRRTIGDRRDTVVLFDLPDVRRVLERARILGRLLRALLLLQRRLAGPAVPRAAASAWSRSSGTTTTSTWSSTRSRASDDGSGPAAPGGDARGAP